MTRKTAKEPVERREEVRKEIVREVWWENGGWMARVMRRDIGAAMLYRDVSGDDTMDTILKQTEPAMTLAGFEKQWAKDMNPKLHYPVKS